MLFFKPQFVKDAEQLLAYAHKLLKYKRDILKPEIMDELQAAMEQLKTLIKSKDADAKVAGEQMDHLSKLLERQSPPRKELGWRENVEVFVVAFVVAAGIRAYILQPFKIPTGSMQPTLNGIIVTKTDKAPPNELQKALELALYGRSYFSLTSTQDDQLIGMEAVKVSRFFDGTRVKTRKGQQFLVPAPPAPLAEAYGISRDAPVFLIKAGKPFMQGYATVGDHVFVDRMTYNFRQPKRDDVFVFLTKGIKPIEASGGAAGQFYIKRLVGLPGDKIRVEQPGIKINGVIPELPGIQRVINAQNGYKGYVFPSGSSQSIERSTMEELQGNSMVWVDGGYEHTVGPHSYYAMGDNSRNSWDSRNWGDIPEKNAVGRGVFVWWPFGPHWGVVK